jgi:hypothetical protein
MKGLKLSLVVLTATLLTIGLGGMAFAFHEGGVAYCDGCHTMHNTRNNVIMTKNTLPKGTANAYLLQGQDQSSTCLVCHGRGGGSGYYVYDASAVKGGPVVRNYTPGGDFAWLKFDYLWTTPRSGNSLGKTHGHNVVALDFGLGPDDRFPIGAPGGSYPQASLGCHSCHDPHGKYRVVDAAGNIALPSIGTAVSPIMGSGSYGEVPTATEAVGVYRLLGGKNYQPKSLTGSFQFANDPPVAVAPETYNRSEQTTDTRVAYGKGMSLWCANCHSGLHNDSYPTNLRHPSGSVLKAEQIANYNAYVKSGDLSGTVGTAYNSLIPFEEGTSTIATLAPHAVTDGSQKGGADSSSVVMCLSCHRAHASAWDSAGRWNFRMEFLTEGGAYPGNNDTSSTPSQGRTLLEHQAGYNDRLATHPNFATYQRSLCNKCHAKD